MSDECPRCRTQAIWATSDGRFLCVGCNADRRDGVGGIDPTVKMEMITVVNIHKEMPIKTLSVGRLFRWKGKKNQ